MVLDKIVAAKQAFIQTLAPLNPATLAASEQDFFKAVQSKKLAVIAELKAASPSMGVIRAEYDPVALAREYVKGGAAALSVLTDAPFFQGSLAHLAAVRAAVELPLLCKDFILDVNQVFHARKNGADAVLLIARILKPAQLQILKSAIEDLNMLPLIEVFDEADLDLALSLSPKILLVNNRNLDSLHLNLNNTASILHEIPQEIEVIAASGLKTPADVNNYPPRIRAVLVGTMLMESSNPAQLIQELLACRA